MNSISYVIYTSGSTGKPKGAQLSYLNFYTALYGYMDRKLLIPTDNCIQMAACTFDVHMIECMGPICIGGQVTMLKKREIKIFNI